MPDSSFSDSEEEDIVEIQGKGRIAMCTTLIDFMEHCAAPVARKGSNLKVNRELKEVMELGRVAKDTAAALESGIVFPKTLSSALIKMSARIPGVQIPRSVDPVFEAPCPDIDERVVTHSHMRTISSLALGLQVELAHGVNIPSSETLTTDSKVKTLSALNCPLGVDTLIPVPPKDQDRIHEMNGSDWAPFLHPEQMHGVIGRCDEDKTKHLVFLDLGDEADFLSHLSMPLRADTRLVVGYDLTNPPTLRFEEALTNSLHNCAVEFMGCGLRRTGMKSEYPSKIPTGVSVSAMPLRALFLSRLDDPGAFPPDCVFTIAGGPSYKDLESLEREDRQLRVFSNLGSGMIDKVMFPPELQKGKPKEEEGPRRKKRKTKREESDSEE